MELYVHSPNTPSWRGAPLKKAQGQLYLLPWMSYLSNENYSKGTNYSPYRCHHVTKYIGGGEGMSQRVLKCGSR
jgi:hypothetical protein